MEKLEKMAKLSELCEMKCKVQAWVNEELGRGKEMVDTKEMGEAVDILKDLCEAEKCCMESMYYESVIEAMDSAKYDDYRMGYNGRKPRMRSWRPIGDIPYKPGVDQEPYIDEYLDAEMMSAGYTHNGNRSQSGSRMSGGRMGGRMGYTEDEHASMQDRLADTLSSARDIWRSADPDMRKRMQADFKELLAEMNK